MVSTVALGGVARSLLQAVEAARNRWSERDAAAADSGALFLSRRGRGSFTYSWAAFMGACAVGGVLLFVLGTPSEAAVEEGTYDQFFGTCAQVIAALVIALAIESAVARPAGEPPEPRGEATQAFVCIALGEIFAIAALAPGLPAWFYGVAIVAAGAAVLAGLLALVLVGRSRMTGRGAARRTRSPRRPVQAPAEPLDPAPDEAESSSDD